MSRFRIRFIEQALQYEWRDKRVHDSDLRMSSPDATLACNYRGICAVWTVGDRRLFRWLRRVNEALVRQMGE